MYSGHDNGKSCGTEVAVEKLVGYENEDVTYCLKVVNDGNTYLNQVFVADPGLAFRDSTTIGLLKPGDAVTLSVPRKLESTTSNTATVGAVSSFFVVTNRMS